jgi:hypothetical protein
VRAVCSVSDRVRPADWGGGSGFYDAFVEVAPAD